MPVHNSKRVGLLIFGADGYMGGRNALKCLPRICRELATQGITVEVPILADFSFFKKDPDIAASARARADAAIASLNLNTKTDYLETADDAIRRVVAERTTYDDYDAIVAYDATPAQNHEDHLIKVLTSGTPNLFYFGEKPLITDPAQLRLIKASTGLPPFFCDFIETKNPAVVLMQRFIVENRLTIEGMRFWRAGASGIKHIIGHDQNGVEGGALLDKAPHDLAIAAMLLGPDRIQNFKINTANVYHLIPKLDDGGNLTFLDKKNHFLSKAELSFDLHGPERANRQKLPADGLCEFAMQWTVGDGEAVPCKFVASWLGYLGHADHKNAHRCEEEFVSELLALDINPNTWLMAERATGTSGRTCIERQARIAIVDTRDSRGRSVKLVANFLIHENDGGAFNRWVKVFRDGDKLPLNIPVDNAASYPEQKEIDLANVFKSVIVDCTGGAKANNLSSTAATWVHDALLQAHDTCMGAAHQSLKEGKMDHSLTWKYIKSCFVD
jgi:predicted dehydrogenase